MGWEINAALINVSHLRRGEGEHHFQWENLELMLFQTPPKAELLVKSSPCRCRGGRQNPGSSSQGHRGCCSPQGNSQGSGEEVTMCCSCAKLCLSFGCDLFCLGASWGLQKSLTWLCEFGHSFAAPLQSVGVPSREQGCW